MRVSDRSRHWILADIALLCLGLHSLGFQRVFVDGQVILAWDPYLAFPTGAGVPWPPLYDLLVGSR